MSDRVFPGESAEYRRQRDELLEAEIELRAQIEKVAAQRRSLPKGGMLNENYVFEATTGESSQLKDLFRPGHQSLAIYSFMFHPEHENPCSSCTSVIDGLNASAPHIEQQMSIAVIAKAAPNKLKRFALDRGWNNLTLLSSLNNTYNRDYLAEDEAGNQMPMLNIFQRTEGGIHHFWGSEMLYAECAPEQHPRHVDSIWPLWNLLDLSPEGRRSDWNLALNYEKDELSGS